MRKLLYFGSYNPTYPRNSILRSGLAEAGWRIEQCRVDINLNPVLQNVLLFYRYLKLANKDFDVIYLAERGQYVCLLAWLISKASQKPLIIDFLYSRHNTQIEKNAVNPGSLQAKILWFFDWLCLFLGDMIVSDTGSHIDYYRKEFSLDAKKAIAIYLGVDTNIYRPSPIESCCKKRLVFWGSYTPSHGVDTIIKTANLASGMDEMEFILIGNGPTYKSAVALAQSLKLRNVIFLPWMDQQKLAEIANQADIVIGAVGRTEKSRRSICFKEFQGMALRKPVITADTPAVREIFTDRENILMCEAANPTSLLDSILQLLNDDHLRTRLSACGYDLIMHKYSPGQLGAQLSEAISKNCLSIKS